jgi:hypothetical protein
MGLLEKRNPPRLLVRRVNGELSHSIVSIHGKLNQADFPIKVLQVNLLPAIRESTSKNRSPSCQRRFDALGVKLR